MYWALMQRQDQSAKMLTKPPASKDGFGQKFHAAHLDTLQVRTTGSLDLSSSGFFLGEEQVKAHRAGQIMSRFYMKCIKPALAGAYSAEAVDRSRSF